MNRLDFLRVQEERLSLQREFIHGKCVVLSELITRLESELEGYKRLEDSYSNDLRLVRAGIEDEIESQQCQQCGEDKNE